MTEGVSVTVRGAHKRDAGRAIARLPEAVRSDLGVLSGDPIVVAGDGSAVLKVWPADADGRFVRIDGETRDHAGLSVGDEATVQPASVDDADRVRLRARPGYESAASTPDTVGDRLADRLVAPDERLELDGLGTFDVVETEPDGAVRVGAETTVQLQAPDPDASTERVTAATTPTEARDGVTYEDIGGLDDELDRVREMIELPLADPETFGQLGIDPPSGVLLHGPPGTGKTLIARAVANEVDAHFETISGPEIVSKFKGTSEQRLREAFERATEQAPAILFIDEIDSIATARGEEGDMEARVVAQLLTLMDGLEDRGRVIVIGATNRVDAVDPALRRGGRREILDVHTRDVPLADDVDLDRLASETHGFVGADLEALTAEAAMAALRRGAETPRVTRADVQTAMAAVDPSAMREYVAESPTVTFEDVGGLDDVADRLREVVEWPLSYGPLFDAANADPPTGVLLHGPPGTGKTLLARAVAGESGVNFLHVNGPELLDRYVGESEKAVRELFERARRTAPAIVFLDEIDAVATRRADGDAVGERVVSQLLTELDRVAEDPTVAVLAATNRPEAIDEALRRPGRLELELAVPVPDEGARREILAILCADRPLGHDVDIADLAARTEGYSGADLAALVRETSMRVIRRVADDVAPDAAGEHTDAVELSAADFEAALETVDSGQGDQ